MKIAYLILGHKFPYQVSNLINRLESDDVSFFIHIDKKSIPKVFEFKDDILENLNNKDNVFFTKNNIDVRWGGFSFSEAIFALMEEAYNKSYFDYFSLLSVQDYPIKSNKHIYNYLSANMGKSLIEHDHYDDINKKLNRLNRRYFYDYYVKDYNKSQLYNLPFRMLTKILPKRKVNFKPYFGRVWWFLHKDAVKFILEEYKRSNSIINFLKKSLLPEEILFPTLLINSKLKDSLINMRTTEADYSSAHPKIISENDIPSLIKSDAFFARKFEYDLNLFKKIDEAIENSN